MPVIIRAAPKSSRRELYIESAVLPLEDPNQFAAFFDELCQELKPVGLLEEDQVATIAKLLWRKHRLKVFRNAEQARAKFYRTKRKNSTPQFPSAKERALILARYIQEEEAKLGSETNGSASPDETLEDMASSLAPHMVQIEEMLCSATDSSASPDDTRADEVSESADGKEQAALRDVTVERYIEDLELMERLDASVERASGRLQKYQTKRMTGSLSRPAADHRAPRWGRVRQ